MDEYEWGGGDKMPKLFIWTEKSSWNLQKKKKNI